MAIYTYSNLYSIVNGRIHNKIGILADPRVSINTGVREAFSLVDLRSAKRKASAAPNLFNDIYQYSCPADMKGTKIISFQPQNMERGRFNSWQKIGEDEFDRRKFDETNLVSFTDRDLIRKTLVSASVNDDGFVVSPLDALTGSGSWALFGDGTNVSTDSYQYVKGSASIKFDISAAGGTTAGIQATNIPTFDLTNFKSSGSVFVWAWITSATNLTNYILRLGNDSSNYYSMTVTATNEGTAFVTGWNLLRFDFSGKSTTGTVTDTACDYAAIYMTKTAGKISETDYRFDHIMVKLGQIFNLIYYSKYPWQTSGGTYIADSTADSDYLNVDTEEFDIIVEKCVERCANEVREDTDAINARRDFREAVSEYRKIYKSEAIQSQSTTYYF